MALKRQVLEEASRCFFAGEDAGRKRALAEYMRARPEVVEYAAFRARVESARADWRSRPDEPAWDDRWDPWADVPQTAGYPAAARYHLYCQWQVEEQLSRLVQSVTAGDSGGRSAGAGLMLDLPVGVHPGGFDTRRWPRLFASGMSIGAPPDSFFARGQDWDSPPLHPERIRDEGHRYFARCLQQHMQYADYLRIDHVMSLHRLFWVPEGRDPSDGVYVGYPADELYALLCLESHRARTVVVGEDLGTVAPRLRSAMRRRGMLGTWVLQSSLRPRAAHPIDPPARHVLAGLGTHDMSPFAGFVRGDDIAARVETGQMEQDHSPRAAAERRRLVARLTASLPELRGISASLPAPRSCTDSAEAGLLQRALAYLADSDATVVMVNLDDLLLETGSQNMPGTGAERGNWRRKIGADESDIRRAIVAAGRRLAGRKRAASG
jgi:4-alpha-glucanotransferase